MKKKITFLGLSWAIGDQSGWEIFGLNLTLHLLRSRRFTPLLLCGERLRGSAAAKAEIDDIAQASERIIYNLRHMPENQVATLPEAAVIHGLGNDLTWGQLSERFRGGLDIGMCFFERTNFSSEAIRRAHSFDLILAGSSWNMHVLKRIGLEKVALGLQGVDTRQFHPRPRTGRFGDRFVVFSGGKVEIRKGQDIVLTAFKHFRERHDDALLVTAWQSPWSATFAHEMQISPYGVGVPPVGEDGRLDAVAWAVANGIPADSVVDLGWREPAEMADLLADVDVAMFPNRAEGGTNLVAMEAMASGVPCILSANTGHVDLLQEGCCYPLIKQAAVNSNDNSTYDWGESSIEEALFALESAYQNSAERRARGEAAAAMMKGWDWSIAIDKMLTKIEDLT